MSEEQQAVIAKIVHGEPAAEIPGADHADIREIGWFLEERIGFNQLGKILLHKVLHLTARSWLFGQKHCCTDIGYLNPAIFAISHTGYSVSRVPRPKIVSNGT